MFQALCKAVLFLKTSFAESTNISKVFIRLSGGRASVTSPSFQKVVVLLAKWAFFVFFVVLLSKHMLCKSTFCFKALWFLELKCSVSNPLLVALWMTQWAERKQKGKNEERSLFLWGQLFVSKWEHLWIEGHLFWKGLCNQNVDAVLLLQNQKGSYLRLRVVRPRPNKTIRQIFENHESMADSK